MTQSKLRVPFERLGPVRVESPGQSGSPAGVVLRLASDRGRTRVIDAVRVLMANGLTMLKAKRAIEAVLEGGEIAVWLPAVESVEQLAAQLREADYLATAIAADAVDVKALRERLGLTQEQFALRYNLSLESVQIWEGGRQPDRSASSYLRVIAAVPEAAAAAQDVAVA